MGIQKSDLRVKIDNVEQNIFSVNLVGGDTKITFNRSIHFNGDTSGLGGARPNDTLLEITVSNDAITRLSTSLPSEYNYTKLGKLGQRQEYLECRIMGLEIIIFKMIYMWR